MLTLVFIALAVTVVVALVLRSAYEAGYRAGCSDTILAFTLNEAEPAEREPELSGDR